MNNIDTSMSSRNFREHLLTASIWSIFKRGGSSPATTDNTRNQSSTTDASTGELIKSKERLPDEAQIPTNSNNSNGLFGVDGSSDLPIEERRDDPFAGGVEGGIEYQTMVWWHAGMVMVAETISLGILSLPMAMATLGIIPGLILLLGLGAMATYSGLVIGQFKTMYPHIHSWTEAGYILYGRFGGEFLGAGQLLFFIFIMGSHILTFSVMMNAITDHGSCTIIFMLVGTIISILFTIPRTLKNLSYYSVISFISVIAAVFITMIGVSITKPGQHQDLVTGNWIKDVRLWPKPDLEFHTAFLAMTNMVFAYAGHVAFFGFISELRDPKDFPKALAFLQVSDITMYIVSAIVIYYYAGNTVASPALDSASPVVRKIAYGMAIPTIVIAGVVNAHVAAKSLYVRLLRNSKDNVMHQKSFKARGIWFALCTVMWIVSWLIAEGIPVFNDLLGVTSALFASWFTFGLAGVFWFHMNFQRGDRWWQYGPKQQWSCMTAIACAASVLNLLAGIIMCVVGLYASGMSISHNSITKKPFSCADNSGFRGVAE